MHVFPSNRSDGLPFLFFSLLLLLFSFLCACSSSVRENVSRLAIVSFLVDGRVVFNFLESMRATTPDVIWGSYRGTG